MKQTVLALAISLAATAAAAEAITKVAANGTVPKTMEALVAAVEGAGATVFARVDHAQGAQSVGMELPPAQVLIFGNPKLGTPVMQQDPLAGVVLPLRVLVYQDAAGKVWLAYEQPDEMFDDLSVDEKSASVKMMEGALKKLTEAAAK